MSLRMDDVKKSTTKKDTAEWHETFEWSHLSDKALLHMELKRNGELMGFADLDMKRVSSNPEGCLRNFYLPMALPGLKEGWLEITVIPTRMLEEARAALRQIAKLHVEIVYGTFLFEEPDDLFILVQTTPGARCRHRTAPTTPVPQLNQTLRVDWAESIDADILNERALQLRVYRKGRFGNDDLVGLGEVALDELDLHRPGTAGPTKRQVPIRRKRKPGGHIWISYAADLPPNVFGPRRRSGVPAWEAGPGPAPLSPASQQSVQRHRSLLAVQPAPLAPAPRALCVEVREAVDLPARLGGLAGKRGTIEPYVRVSSTTDQQTTATKTGCNPSWGERFQFYVERDATLWFEVRDGAPLHAATLCGASVELLGLPTGASPKWEWLKLMKDPGGQPAGRLLVSFTWVDSPDPRPNAPQLRSRSVPIVPHSPDSPRPQRPDEPDGSLSGRRSRDPTPADRSPVFISVDAQPQALTQRLGASALARARAQSWSGGPSCLPPPPPLVIPRLTAHVIAAPLFPDETQSPSPRGSFPTPVSFSPSRSLAASQALSPRSLVHDFPPDPLSPFRGPLSPRPRPRSQPPPPRIGPW